MAFNENINFWTNQTVASGESMSAPLEKLLENDNYLKNKSDENEPKVFFAEYEITTFEEVTNALAANKMVFLRKIITVSEENHVIYLPLSNKKTSEPNVYTFSGISGHRGDLVISFTLSENDIWSLGNDSFPSKQIQVVAYGSTSLTDINSYFNKGLYLVCNRGNEYLPLIRRSLINDSYEYIFSGSYEDKVVKLKCEVSGWSEEVIGLKTIIVDEDASITGSTATVSIEQGDLCVVDLSEETSLTAIEIVLTNNASVANPLWWFKIESGSAVTLSVKIGSVAVGWLGSAITNIALGKTIEVSVADGVACGGELV